MKGFIELKEGGTSFLLNARAIISVDERDEKRKRAIRVKTGDTTDVYLADETMDEILTKLEECRKRRNIF